MTSLAAPGHRMSHKGPTVGTATHSHKGIGYQLPEGINMQQVPTKHQFCIKIIHIVTMLSQDVPHVNIKIKWQLSQRNVGQPAMIGHPPHIVIL